LNPESSIAGLPEAVRSMLGPVEVYPFLDAVALREMSKFSEITNVHGLALHPISLPPDPDGLLESSGCLEDLPTAVFVQLREAIRTRPQILLRGTFAGTMAHPFPVAALFCQDDAAIAQAWDALLWREEPETPAEPALTFIHCSKFPQPILLSLPDEGVALILGTDDPRPGLFVALEWANRHWGARNELIKLKKLEAGSEPSVILDGGSFVFRDPPQSGPGAAESSTTLVYPGESIPISWEEILRESLPELTDVGEADLLLAGAEPWCAEGGGRLAPFWKNPVLPAPLLLHAERWQTAALAPGALPFGLAVSSGGQIDWQASSEEGFVIAPRSMTPAPFVNSAVPRRPSRHYTHRAMKPEAMELWALGLPSPEVLGPGSTL
jgi:hypothetical protein